MPRGPKGEKRPADVIGNAVHVMKVSTGEIDDITTCTSGLPREADNFRAGRHFAFVPEGDIAATVLNQK
jgi:hypothetical protein